MAVNRKNPISRKANQQAREAIASILLMEVSDPRLQRVTVTSVDVSPDKRNARIYYTAAKEDYQSVEESLSSAKGYIRKLLGGRLGWRVVPELRFYLDPSIDIGEIISSAFIKEEQRKSARDDARAAASDDVADAQSDARDDARDDARSTSRYDARSAADDIAE